MLPVQETDAGSVGRADGVNQPFDLTYNNSYTSFELLWLKYCRFSAKEIIDQQP